MMDKKKALLIDTYAFLYRAYYASESHPLQNNRGEEVGAYMGFFSTVLYLIKELKPSHIVFASDSSSPSKRKELCTDYKANRDKMPDSLRDQIAFVKKALECATFAVLKEDGLEADDILVDIASRFSKEGFDTVIATGDKDILQVVDDEKHIAVFRPPSFGTKWTLYNENTIKEKYGFGKESMASFLSILGDSSDNIKGIAGIGEKGAKELLTSYKTLDEIYEHIGDITNTRLKNKLIEGKADAYFSYSLARLGVYDYSGEFAIDSYALENVNFTAFLEKLKKDGLYKLAERFSTSLNELGVNINNTISDQSINKNGEDDEFVYTCKNVSIDECIADIKDALLLSIFITSDEEVFSYSLDGKIEKYISLNESYIKIISKSIKEFLSSPFNSLFSFDVKHIAKITDTSLKEVKAQVYDIEILAYLEDSENSYFTPEYLCQKYLHKSIKKGEEKEASLFEEKEVSLFESALSYNLCPYIEEALKTNSLLDYYNTIEKPLIFILASMENKGIYLDKNEIEILKASLDERLLKLEKEIYNLAGTKFNIASPQQFSKILFEDLNLKNGKKNKSGYKVDKEVLESLEDAHPIVRAVLEYRSLAKLKTTYTDALTSLISKTDGRLHTTFLQTGTATGRFSSKNPNLQNIPVRNTEGRLVRKAFKASEGNVLLSSDYSQIELVVLSHFSNDKELVSMFNTGEDVHRLTASKIFKKNPSEITPEERRVAKTINFGVIYGMSAFRLQKDLGVSRREASEFLESYFHLFSGVREFIDDSIKKVRETLFTTTILGHKRFFKTINDSNKNIRDATERAAVNSIIQGSAADILKKAMIDIALSTDESDRAKLLLNVHDELIFEVSKDTVDSYEKKVEEAMTHSVKLIVPLRVSIEKSESWGDMH